MTYLVGVAEKEPSDFLVEQGLLVGTTEFFAKSHALKREDEDEEHPFGRMQDGVFELFNREGGCIAGRPKRNLSRRLRSFRSGWERHVLRAVLKTNAL